MLRARRGAGTLAPLFQVCGFLALCFAIGVIGDGTSEQPVTADAPTTTSEPPTTGDVMTSEPPTTGDVTTSEPSTTGDVTTSEPLPTADPPPTPAATPPPTGAAPPLASLSATLTMSVTADSTSSTSRSASSTSSATLSEEETPSQTQSGEDSETASLSGSASDEGATTTITASQSAESTASRSVADTLTTTSSFSTSLLASTTTTLTITGSSSGSRTVAAPTLAAVPAAIDGAAIQFAWPSAARTVKFVTTGTSFDPSAVSGTGHVDHHLRCAVHSSRDAEGAAAFLRDMLPLDGASSTLRTNARGELVVEVVLQPVAAFYIQYDEVVRCSVQRDLFADKHFDANVTFHIRAATAKVAASHAAVAVARAISLPASLLAAAAASHVLPLLLVPRANALLHLEACVFQLGAPLTADIHPFSFAIGADDARHHAGAAIMNSTLVVALAALHLFAAHAVYERRRRRWGGTNSFGAVLTALRFPALLAAVAFFFLQRTLEAALVVLVHGRTESTRAPSGVLFVGWVLALAALIVRTLRPFGAVFAAAAAVPPVVLAHAPPHPHDDRGSCAATVASLCGRRGQWDDDDFFRSGNEGFCNMYGLLFDAYRGRRHGFVVVEVLLAVVHAAVGAVMPRRGACGALRATLITFELLALLSVVIARPHRFAADDAMRIAFGLVVVVAVSLQVAHAHTGDAATLATSSWSVVALLLVLAVRAVASVLAALVQLAASARRLVLDHRREREDAALKSFLTAPQRDGTGDRMGITSLLAEAQREQKERKTHSGGSVGDQTLDGNGAALGLRYRHPRRKRRVGRSRAEAVGGDASSEEDRRWRLAPSPPRRNPLLHGARAPRLDGIFVHDSDNSELAEMRVSARAARRRAQSSWERAGAAALPVLPRPGRYPQHYYETVARERRALERYRRGSTPAHGLQDRNRRPRRWDDPRTPPADCAYSSGYSYSSGYTSYSDQDSDWRREMRDTPQSSRRPTPKWRPKTAEDYL